MENESIGNLIWSNCVRVIQNKLEKSIDNSIYNYARGMYSKGTNLVEMPVYLISGSNYVVVRVSIVDSVEKLNEN